MQFRTLVVALSASLAGISLIPAVAHAQAATDLDNVQVTATRTASTVDQALAAVEVIDRAQIERSQAQSLPDLLRGRTGINLSNQGGAGKLTTLFLRGTESDHVLVLVDGIRIGSATSGLASFQDLPLAQIDRIEIVRGPRSSLYGADAIGGVIQIFTRRASQGVSPRVALTAGSHHRREASAGIDVGNGRGWFGADAAYKRTDGINACNVATPTPYSGGCFISTAQPDRDGYRNKSVSLRGGFNASDAFSVEARALRAEGHNDYDGDFVDNSDIVQQVVGGSVRWTPTASAQFKLNVGRNVDASDNFLGSTFSNRFATTRDTATLQGDFGLGEGQTLTAGADWQRDIADVDDPYSAFDAQRLNRAVFVQYQGTFGVHALQAAVRRDRDDQFGGHNTGSVAWGMELGGDLRLTASYGTAFKAPTFNELYYPYFGNPDLDPESSRSLEAGLGQRKASWHWQFNAYQTRINDLIAWDASINLPNNVDRARIRGVELVLGASLAGWDLQAQAGHIDPRNASRGTYHDNVLARRARNSARVDADRKLGRFAFGASVVGEGRRYDDVANTLELGGYATVDLRAEFAFAKDWRVQGGINNVFDRQYNTAAFYNQPGRELSLTVRYAPQQ